MPGARKRGGVATTPVARGCECVPDQVYGVPRMRSTHQRQSHFTCFGFASAHDNVNWRSSVNELSLVSDAIL